MTFYNPIIPPLMPPFFSSNYYNKNSQPSELKNTPSQLASSNFHKNSDINQDSSCNNRESPKSKKNTFLNNPLFDNIFSEIQESDTLILLALIYLLYIQGNNDTIIYFLLLILINI